MELSEIRCFYQICKLFYGNEVEDGILSGYMDEVYTINIDYHAIARTTGVNIKQEMLYPGMYGQNSKRVQDKVRPWTELKEFVKESRGQTVYIQKDWLGQSARCLCGIYLGLDLDPDTAIKTLVRLCLYTLSYRLDLIPLWAIDEDYLKDHISQRPSDIERIPQQYMTKELLMFVTETRKDYYHRLPDYVLTLFTPEEIVESGLYGKEWLESIKDWCCE
jgi:hypothetical protein